MALWGGRFASGPADAMEKLSRSVQFDYRLAPYDIRINVAHVNSLVKNGFLSAGNGEVIKAGLKALLQEALDAKLEYLASDEDIHSCIERSLIIKIGEVGGSIRAGRSRNDLVSTAFKLYITEHLILVAQEIIKLISAINNQSNSLQHVIAPGFTHLQHAQPILFGHELAKHSHALLRDVNRIENWLTTNSVSPFGSGAMSGSALVPTPEAIAAELGFATTVKNSIDGVSDRDWVLEALFIFSLIGIHLSKIGEEFTLWNSSEFSWVRLDDAYSTGSSIMPQKKNPDIAELARGKSGRLVGNLMSMLVTAKGLAFAYNRDLQEDKEPIFDSVETLLVLLPAMTGMIETATFDEEKISAGATAGFSLATEIADYLARSGVPFNQAHELAGACVRFAEGLGIGLEDLSPEQLQEIDSRLGSDLIESLSAQGAISTRTSIMSTGPKALSRQIADLESSLQAVQLTFTNHESTFNKAIYSII